MNGIIKKMIVALAGVTLVGVLALPTRVKAYNFNPSDIPEGWTIGCSNCGADLCSDPSRCGTVNKSTGNKYKCSTISGYDYLISIGDIDIEKVSADIKEELKKITICVPYEKQAKTDEERAEEARRVAEMAAGFDAYFAGNAVVTNEIAALYKVNPGLGLDAQLRYLAEMNLDSYYTQYVDYMTTNGANFALYEAMMNAKAQ